MYPGEKIIFKASDEYGDIVVTEGTMLRALYFGNEKRQSAMFLQHSGLLVLDYSQVMMLSLLFRRQPARVFCVGLGGGSIMKFLQRACPQSHIDVVELRSKVIDVAHRFFDVPRKHPLLNIICADGAEYIRQSDNTYKYDLMFLDGFDHAGPADSVSSTAFVRQAKECLSENGVLCINLWNRPGDNYQQRLRQLGTVFEGAVLRYVLTRKHGNAFVFCFKNPSMMRSLSRYENKAKELQQIFGINFHKLYSRLYRQNVPLLKRLLREAV